MSVRVRAITAAVKAILREPADRRELALLASFLAFYQVQAMAALLRRRRLRRAEPAERWVTVKEASHLAGASRSFLYEHGVQLGLASRREGMRGLRFNVRKLVEWSRGRRP